MVTACRDLLFSLFPFVTIFGQLSFQSTNSHTCHFLNICKYLCCLENQIFGQKIQIPEPQVIMIIVSKWDHLLKILIFFWSKSQISIYAYIWNSLSEVSLWWLLLFCKVRHFCGFQTLQCLALFVPDYSFQTLQCLALFEQKHNISWNWPWVAAQIGQRVHSEMEISNEGISRSSFCN